ncbi:MAG: RcnB family protein [Burkholderiales bacterium]|nr:RcnB family protein [Burkholderiales bacterium]
MRRIALKTAYTLACLVAGILAAGPVLADKPAWAGSGKKQEKNEQRGARDRDNGQDRDGDRQGRKGGGHFADEHRGMVREYYGERFRTGKCPPGLAKKNNGCMPPGQAKKWQVGRPLPRDVIYYDLPQTLIVQLGRPPTGHRYVRVAADILLIAVGTGMVLDAIEDLGRM